jgi:hypothetical protein
MTLSIFFNLGEKIKKLGDELYQKGPKILLVSLCIKVMF